MSDKLARIHFAANDDRGNFTGRAEAIEIELPGDDRAEVAINVRVACFKRSLRIGGRGGVLIPFRDYHEWIGNMAWNAATVRPGDALAVLRYLLARGGCVESYTCGGDIEALVEEFNAR